MTKKSYVVATLRPWNRHTFQEVIRHYDGQWHLITRPEKLNVDRLAALKPRYVFFPHWSEKVTQEILDRWECVGFHETDLPFGRGGSPIQNLIQRGFKDTVVSAIRLVPELDAGPVYLKRPLSLKGRAQEIYKRCAEVVAEMIRQIIDTEPRPIPQSGKPTIFKRRRPEQSRIGVDVADLDRLYDHIRMLDAEEYPPAFFQTGGYRIELTHAEKGQGELRARVRIVRDAGA